MKTKWCMDKEDEGAGGTVTPPPAADDAAKVAEAKAAEDAAKAAEAEAKPKDEDPIEKAKREERETWQKRVNHLTWEKNEEARLRQAAEAKAAEAAKAAGDETPPDKRFVPADQVPLLAEQLAAQKNFDQACNMAHATGMKEFSDFDDTMKTLSATGFLADRASLEAATATPEAHKVLYHLGKNPSEAMRLQALSPMQRAVEMARISLELGKAAPPKKVSGAPAPIAPVGGGGVKGEPDLYDTANMTTEQWIKQREKQIRAQRAAE